jgi:signal transduction histidine kinase
MAAAIAHEVKNPLAGIEVMAGLLKRQLVESPDAQTVLADIIKEAKMANVIVQEVLAFVRPLRLQVEDIAVADVIRDAMTMAESHASLKGEVDVKVDLPEALRPIQGDPHQLRQIFTNLLTNAFEAMGGIGQVEIAAVALDGDDDAGPTEHGTGPHHSDHDSGQRTRHSARGHGSHLQPVLHDQAAGLRPGPRHRPQDRRRARRTDRRAASAPGGGTVFRVWLPVRSQQQLFG